LIQFAGLKAERKSPSATCSLFENRWGRAYLFWDAFDTVFDLFDSALKDSSPLLQICYFFFQPFSDAD